MNTSVVILGASGQLGEVTTAKFKPLSGIHAFSKLQLDICDVEAVKSILLAYEPKVIINLAAYTAVDLAEHEQALAFKVNSSAVENLAKIAPPETLLIHLSTDFVFSGNKTEPYKPADATGPLSAYGKSKLEGEHALFEWHPEHSVVIRTSWLYSAKHKNFVTTMLRLMQERDELNVVSDQYGSPTSAYTLADIIWRFSKRDVIHGIYHWSDEGIISWYDFAVEIQTQATELGLLNKKIPIIPVTTEQYPTPAKRPAFSALDSTTTEELLGVKRLPWQQQLSHVLRKIREDVTI